MIEFLSYLYKILLIWFNSIEFIFILIKLKMPFSDQSPTAFNKANPYLTPSYLIDLSSHI